MDALKCIGSIVKVHGFNGELIFRPLADEKYSFRKGDVLYIHTGHDRVPFFIHNIRKAKENELILSFEDVNTEKTARELCGCDVFSAHKSLKKGPIGTHLEIIGYTLFDESMGEIGPVRDVFSMPPQFIIQVFKNGKEILVPFHPDLTVSIDRKKRILVMNIPEGLIQGYLGE